MANRVNSGGLPPNNVDLDSSQTLSSKTLDSSNTLDGTQLSNADVTNALVLQEQASTPASPSAGDKKLYAKDDGKVYTLDSDGNEIEVGSGAGAGVLYINEDFETGVDNLVAYKDAAQATPEDGTGGSPAVSVSVETAAPLVGPQSARINVPAGGSKLGEGVAILSETVDSAYSDKVHTVEMLWKTSAGYTTGDMSLWVVHPTTGTVEALNFRTALGEYTNELPASDSTVTRIVSELTPIDDTYRIVLHVRTANVDYDVFADDIQVGPQRLIQTSASGPVGEIIALGTDVAPKNFLYCDGSAISRSVYSELFAEIGTNFGSGDGSTTFNLPDLRGQFLRGQDDGAGVDPDAGSRTANNSGGNTGDNVGSEQDDVADLAYPYGDFGTGVGPGGTNSITPSIVISDDQVSPSGLATGVNAANAAATETRPKNVNVRYYIRYKDGSQILSTTQVDQQTVSFRANATSQAINDSVSSVVEFDLNQVGNVEFYVPAVGTYSAAAGNWSTTNPGFSIPKDGFYFVSATVNFVNSASIDQEVAINGSSVPGQNIQHVTRTQGNNTGVTATGVIQAKAGDKLEVIARWRNGSGSTTLSASAARNTFSIHAIPDFTVFGTFPEKNLVQTKTLSGNTSSTGVLSDLTFNNLTVGKFYTGKLHAAYFDTGSNLTNVNFEVSATHDGDALDRIAFRMAGSTIDIDNHLDRRSMTFTFKATATSLTFDVGIADNIEVQGNGTRAATYATLIEHNDLRETDKF